MEVFPHFHPLLRGKGFSVQGWGDGITTQGSLPLNTDPEKYLRGVAHKRAGGGAQGWISLLFQVVLNRDWKEESTAAANRRSLRQKKRNLAM